MLVRQCVSGTTWQWKIGSGGCGGTIEGLETAFVALQTSILVLLFRVFLSRFVRYLFTFQVAEKMANCGENCALVLHGVEDLRLEKVEMPVVGPGQVKIAVKKVSPGLRKGAIWSTIQVGDELVDYSGWGRV